MTHPVAVMATIAASVAAGAGISLMSIAHDPAQPPAVRVAAAARQGCPSIADEDTLTTAVAIALAESGGNPDAFNPIPPDLSLGYWQINMLGPLGPDRRAKFGIGSNDDLFDPVTNAEAMCQISGGGAHWWDWSTHENGAYLDHLGEARQAAQYVLGHGPAPAPQPAKKDPALEGPGDVRAQATAVESLPHLKAAAGWVADKADRGLGWLDDTAGAVCGQLRANPATPDLAAFCR